MLSSDGFVRPDSEGLAKPTLRVCCVRRAAAVFTTGADAHLVEGAGAHAGVLSCNETFCDADVLEADVLLRLPGAIDFFSFKLQQWIRFVRTGAFSCN